MVFFYLKCIVIVETVFSDIFHLKYVVSDFYKVQEAAETNQPLKENVRESSTSNVGASGATSGTGGGNGSSMNGNCVSGERSSKRARRSRADVDVNESQISETRSKSSVNKVDLFFLSI